MDAMDAVESLGSRFALAVKGPDTLGVPFHHGAILGSIETLRSPWFTSLQSGLGNKSYKMSPKL